MKMNVEPFIQRLGNSTDEQNEGVPDHISIVKQYEKPKKRAYTDDELAFYARLNKPVPSKYPISEKGLDAFLKNFEEHVYPVIEEAGGVDRLEAILVRRRAESAKLQKKMREAKERKTKENGE